MEDVEGRKYGFRVVRGGRYAKGLTVGAGPDVHRLDHDMQAAFAALEAVDGTVPSRGVQEIREHRQRPWRVLARRFRECREAGVPFDQAVGIVRALERWVGAIYGHSASRRPSGEFPRAA